MACVNSLLDILIDCNQNLGGLRSIYVIPQPAIIRYEYDELQGIRKVYTKDNYEWNEIQFKANNAQFTENMDWDDDNVCYMNSISLAINLQRMTQEKRVAIERLGKNTLCIIVKDNNGKWRYLENCKCTTISGDTSMQLKGTNQYTIKFETSTTELALYMNDDAVESLHEKEFYTVTGTVVNGAFVGSGTYEEGTEVCVSATPNAGYIFNGWSDGNTDNPRCFIITSNMNFEATMVEQTSFNFNEASDGAKVVTLVWNDCISPLTFTINVNGENGTPYGSGEYSYGDIIEIGITPNDNYRFVQWSDGNTDNPRTIIVNGNMEYTATIEEIPQEQYALNLNGRNGWTLTGSGTYNEGDTILINAVNENDEYYQFYRWMDGETIVSNTASFTYTMPNRDVTLYCAATELPQYTVTIDCEPTSLLNNVTITGEGTYHQGEQCTVNCTPNNNERITVMGWSNGSQSFESNPLTFTVTQNVTMIAQLINGALVLTVDNESKGVYIVDGNGLVTVINSSGEKYEYKINATEEIELYDGDKVYTSDESILLQKKIVEDVNYLYIESLKDGNTVTIQSPYTTASLQTSTDKINWVGADEVSSVTINNGDKLYFRGNDVKNGTSSICPLIDTSGTFNLGGDIATLTDGLGDDTTVGEYQYRGLFKETKVVDASQLILPATTLVKSCYEYMFYGCTGLTTAPTLPATILANYCYYNMFSGCTGLTTTPALPVTTLATYCYYSMFSGCTSLTTAPELPATNLAYGCYKSMFNGCTSLTTAPTLPATTLATYCYQYMFSGCTSLTTAPALPATTLANYCYSDMFSGCTSLTSAPELPATTLASYCYSSMFSGCSNLNYIKALFLTTPSTSYTNNWVDGVADTGTFVKNADATWDVRGVNGVPINWIIEDVNYLYIQSLEDENTVTIQSPYTTASLQTSTDAINWTGADEVSTVTINNGDKLYFKGTNVKNGTSSNYPLITTSGTFNLGGNIATLTDGLGDDTTVVEYQYYNFFRNTKVVDASQLILPATTLESYCYSNMFYGCTSLTTAPELPATTLVDWCYSSMFRGCTSLTSAPALPATTLANSCYQYMFQNCTSLTSAPTLPATTLATYCYQYMFYDCTSLTTAPTLPATTLKNNCYQYMFYDCTSLTTAPTLPATTLASYCYQYMFSGCRGLTSAPTLPATTLEGQCYRFMFRGCSNLNYIKALFLTTPSGNYTNNWVNGVADTGTFVKNADATWNVTGNNGIPLGWTVQTENN